MAQFFSTLPTEVFDAIGVAGFGLYVLNYAMLTFQRLSSASITYFAINWRRLAARPNLYHNAQKLAAPETPCA